MRSISDFYVLAQGKKNGIHRFLISCVITHADGQVTDLTGDNAIVFPDFLSDLTLRQRRNVVKSLVPMLLELKFNPDLHDSD
jgi:hypothetical protein